MTAQPIGPLEPAKIDKADCSKCAAHVAAHCALSPQSKREVICDQKSDKEPAQFWLELLLFAALVAASFAAMSGQLLGFASHQQLGVLAFGFVILLAWALTRDHFRAVRNALVRQIDQERIEALGEAEQSERVARKASDAAAIAKSSLVANMSHEIRTPMNGVIGFAQLLLSTRLTQEQRKYAELILESGDSMVALLNDILDIAKIESGKMEVHPVPTNVRDLVTSATSMMKAAARQKHLDMEVQISSDIPRELMLDGLRVKQVMSNLIGNAIKFTDTGSVNISLNAVDAGKQRLLEIEVRDTGIGIAPEWQSVIFEQFVQADDSSQRAYGGSGLGLSISRKLAQLMHGTLTLESNEGEGTQVILRIPLIKPRALGQKRAAETGRPSKFERFAKRRGTVLIAEDSELNRLLMEEMLGNLGYHTKTAETGEEALAIVSDAGESAEPFDLVLMDVQMPEMDGLEATKQLRAMGYDGDTLPIIALTANAFQSDIDACFGAGMQEHLAKPVSQRDLIEVLDRWLVPAL